VKDPARANRRTALLLGGFALAMAGFGYAMVPLYQVFCDITGLNGKTGVVSTEEAYRLTVQRDRWITVEFDANVHADLPWGFKPAQRKMKVRPGQISETTYYASNNTAHAGAGQAVPSVAPGVASSYFNKIECFCFDRQTLAAGERRPMPVRFVIDPELPEDITTLTLSYTFFLVPGEVASSQARQPTDAPGRG